MAVSKWGKGYFITPFFGPLFRLGVQAAYPFNRVNFYLT